MRAARSWRARATWCQASPSSAYRYIDDVRPWIGLPALTGLPVTTAPIARSDEGLPIGVQIIGPECEDRTPIEFARLIEREFGGFVAPPGFS